MLTKNNVDDVLVQTTYMSGDRNTIASALRANPRLGVLILVAPGKPSSANELKNFYIEVATAKRVGVHEVAAQHRQTGEAALKSFYRLVGDYCVGKGSFPNWISTSIEHRVRIHSATFGTKVIAWQFQKNSIAARNKVRALWRLDHIQSKTQRSTVNLQSEVWKWLESKGFRKNRSYVFLFAKQGARTAEKAHHFTSILTWRLLQETIAQKTSVIPVAAGDMIGLRTTPTLAEFWKEPEWKRLFKDVIIDPRSAQLGMWCYLAEQFQGVSIIGMRSGMIEVPALVGIRTLYLEEAYNQQAERMAKWIGTVPDFTRQVVNRPPGISQQIYWNSESRKRPPSSNVRRHAATQGGHVQNLVRGFNKANLSSKRPDTLNVHGDPDDVDYAKKLAAATFGQAGLSKTVGAEKFQLAAQEFKSVIDWVSHTPAPSRATGNIHGSVPGHLEKRDVAAQDFAARKQEKTWSEFFASAEYRNSLPSKLPSALADADSSTT